MTPDDIRDLAIRINASLIEAGFVPDDTDTDGTRELEAQDIIASILADHYGITLD